MKQYKTFFVLGVRIDLCYTKQALQFIDDSVRSAMPHTMYFINAHCVNVAQSDVQYREIISKGSLVLNDGIGVRWAARLQGVQILENMVGTDFLPRVFEQAAEKGYRVVLLGGRPGVAQVAAVKLRERLPQLQVVGTLDGYFPESETPRVVEEIRLLNPDILVVAMGVPKQEKWIARYAHLTGARVSVAVGALLDFISERVPRAPAWVRHLGFEWLYRFILEPRRLFKRYILGNPLFLGRVLLARFRGGLPR